MIAEAIKEILKLRREPVIEIDGRKYRADHLGGYVATDEPSPRQLEGFNSLSAIIDYICTGDGNDASVLITHNSARLVSRLHCPWMQRHHYIKSEAIGSSFPFDRYIDIEDFIVKVQCGFASSKGKARLLSFVSTVRGEKVDTQGDDGISQTVETRDSVTGRLKDGTMNPILMLAPYRTFHEVEQPVSAFLLRMRKQSGGAPLVALFEADGDAWKIEAAANIKTWFCENDIIKESNISVIG